MLKSKKLKTILNVVEWLMWAALMAVFLVAVSPVLPLENIPKMYVVVTGSMEPTIKTGSVAIAKPIEPKAVKKGDVIVFTSPNNPKENILHRVYEIKSEVPLTFSTKGDNNNSPDAWDVYGDGVKGIMVGQIPYLGHAAAFVRTPLGFSLLIVLPALIFIISQIFSIKRSINEEIEKGIQRKLKQSTKTMVVVMALTSVAVLPLSVKTVLALFRDTVVVGGISLEVADFAPPPIPALISPDNGSEDSGELRFRWSQVEDVGSSSPVTYLWQGCETEFEGEVCSSGLDQKTIGAEGNLEGSFVFTDYDLPTGLTIYWRVRAIDEAGNRSEWSEVRSTSNTTPTVLSSRITNALGDNTSNHNKKSINYQATGPTGVGRVVLCWDYNLEAVGGSFTCDRESDQSKGAFEFNFSRGEGAYRFYTVAYSTGGDPEDTSGKLTGIYKVQVDWLPPTSGFDLSNIKNNFYWGGQINRADGGSLTEELSVSEIGKDIWYGFGDGVHEIVNNGVDPNGETFYNLSNDESGNLFRIGFGGIDPGTRDGIYQIIDIPQKAVAYLSFWFRGISEDTADYDSLNVRVESIGESTPLIRNILTTGAGELGADSWTSDSGWRGISRDITKFAGKTVKLIFEVINKDVANSPLGTLFYFDRIAVNTTDLRTEGKTEDNLVTADTGSGVGTTTVTDTTVNLNDNQVDYQVTDKVGNTEPNHSQGVVSAPEVVLNMIEYNIDEAQYSGRPEKIEIYRNNKSIVSLSGWFLKNSMGDTWPVPNGSVFSDGSGEGGQLDTIIISPPSTDFIGGTILSAETISLWKTEGGVPIEVDRTTFKPSRPAGGNCSLFWGRTPKGYGTWGNGYGLSNMGQLSAGWNSECVTADLMWLTNLSLRKEAGKLLLTISSVNPLKTGLGDFIEYQISYMVNGLEQQIRGKISTDSMDGATEFGQYDREFFLGTCSDSGCRKETVDIGSEIKVVTWKDSLSSPVEEAPQNNTVTSTIIYQ